MIWRTQFLLVKSRVYAVCRLYRTKYNMEKAYFRNTSDSQELYISFRYKSLTCTLDRNFNFCRKVDEKIDDAVVRIRNSVEKELLKKMRKSKRKGKSEMVAQADEEVSNMEEICIEFFRNGREDSFKDITFAEMMTDPQNLQLKVIDRTYEILVNQPWVVNLVLPTNIMAGFKVYPSKLIMQFAERASSKAKWYKAKMTRSGNAPPTEGGVWLECGDGFFYNTTNEDVGFYLKFELVPANSQGEYGPVAEIIAKNAIQAGPGLCPFQIRHCFTATRLSKGDSFRVISYNLLADLYADSEYSRTQLFPYCPPYALKMDYRKQLFIKEIEGYNADVMCLQEVDMKIFDGDLRPVFETLNYAGLIEQKGTSGEGLAMFYRRDRFDLVKTHGLNIGDSIRKLPELVDIWEKIATNPKLVGRVCERSTTLQFSLLRCRDNGRYLMMANTHLYFHPDADHIRLLQIGIAMRHMEHMCRTIKSELNLGKDEDIDLVFCGDFNSVPECGIFKLMTEKCVESDFPDWSSNKEEAVTDITLTQPFNMKSACGTPQYTNFTNGFAACLDYIFYKCDGLLVEQAVPMPTEEELKAHIAIPSVVFPSDHVALVADLRFRF